MPEPVSIVSAALGIVASTYTLCKTSSEIASGVKDAPHHISRISEDLQNFYPILRALQVAFEKLKTSSDSLIEETCAAVHRSLQNCVRIFRDLTLLVNKYKSLQPLAPGNTVSYHDSSGKLVVGKWNSVKWDFQRKEVEALTSTLTQCKETCQLAVSTAHFICGQSAANRAQKTLQQNNELLKALLAKVISNDQSVRRESIFLDSDYRPASIIDLYCNSRSGRLSDYLTDVESTLSSSPISTARSSIATQRVSLDPELRVLRQSFHEILTGETEQEVDDAIPDSPAVSNDVSYTTNANKSSPGVPEDKRFDLAAHSDAQNETKLESQTSIRWLQGSRPEYTATDFETLCLYPMNTWTFRIDLARIYYQPINNYLNISDLHREILRGHPDLDRATLEWLLAKGVALDSKNEHGWTAMGVAIFVRDLRVAKLLHEVGAETYSWPNQPGGFSDPLELALRYRDYNIVLWLITAGIGVNLAGALNNPFRIALINQDINVAAFILSQEIRADSPFHLSGTTKADLLDHINRVPARIASSYPSTILHSSIAARLPFHELPMLPKLGANVNVRDYIGQTPHHCFCTPSTYAEDAPLILECLLDFKPDLEIQDKFGSTALHLAADGPEWIFQRLLRAGANPHCKNVKGSSPLDLAKKKRRQALL